jgi:glutamate 5-kinase
MRTKLEAARIAMGAGCQMAITSGRVEHPIRALAKGGRATWFVPASTPRAARKQWIAGTLQPKGMLHLDAGARAALNAGRSLLPAGVTAVDGHFDRGDTVSLVDTEGLEIGRGLVAYGADEARAIIGQQSAAIPEILGYRGREELIHRDDLVILGPRRGVSP